MNERRATVGWPVFDGAEGSNGSKPFVPEAVEYNKESHRTMKLFSRRTGNGFHNSRQVAKCPANLIVRPY